MVKFSIIIPVYRAEHTIRRCVESIENNTFKDLEIILVEDGSKDNSWAVCRQLAAEFQNVKAIHNEKNSGVSYTRNRGLDAASGTYTMFVDSDDWVDQNYYEVFSQTVDGAPEAFAICGYLNHDEKHSGRTDKYCWDLDTESNALQLKETLQKIYDKCMLQQLWNKAFRTDVIKKNHIRFDESISIGEDFRFILAYLKASEICSVVMINKAVYHYMRDQDGSLMYRIGYESVEEPLKNLRNMYELMGMDSDVINERISEERNNQIEQYAYLIMHNAGMKMREKKRLILALDSGKGNKLYRKNKKKIQKERIAKLLYFK